MPFRHRLVSVIIVLLWASCSALSQSNSETKQATPPHASEQERPWSEVWRNATIAFGEILTDGLTHRPYFHAVGAGVTIGIDKATAYLVTVRHMFCDPDKRSYPPELHVRFAWQDHRSVYEYLGVPLPLRDQAGSDRWSSLDDGSDIAAIEWPIGFFADLPAADRPKNDLVDSIPFEDVAGGVFEGQPIYILGYPEVVDNEKLVRPIMRQGIVAWTNPNEPDDRPFLVDASVVPGNSGGPVIKFPLGLQKDGSVKYVGSGKLQLLGLVSQARSEVFNIRIGNQVSSASVAGVGAIGEIEPSSRIRKLITAMQQGKLKPSTCEVPAVK